MKWNSKSLFILLASLMLVISACSSEKKGSETKNPLPTPSPSEGTSEKTHKITGITYLYGNPPPNSGEGLKALNERFNVDYFVEKVPQENYTEKLSAVVSGGSMPDMIGFMPDDQNFHRWAKQGAFLPLNDYIDQYPTLKEIPDELWSPFTIDGKIYGIPSWSAVESGSYIIRKDWLDNLGLEIPTSYEELKDVLIAFTKDDPDQNGKDDTYGLAIGENINPNYGLGPYFLFDSWYHQDENGDFLPTIITEGRKQLIEFFYDLYKEGAMTRDFAVMNWVDTNAEFYSGKAGLFLIAPRGMSQAYMEGLLEIDPGAEFAVLPPFEADDGSKGYVAGRGFARYNAFNANLADDPDKLHKILEMHDFSRQHYSSTELETNEDHDWFYGGKGVGYEINDGSRTILDAESGKQPYLYFLDSTGWLPEGAPPEYEKAYTEPKLIQATLDLLELNEQYPLYFNPHVGVISEAESQHGAEVMQYLMNEQTKMIVGQRSIDDWDLMVEEYMKKGGSKIIEEINAGIKERGITEKVWK